MRQKNSLVLPIGVEGGYDSNGLTPHGPDNDQASASLGLPYRNPPILVLELIIQIDRIAQKDSRRLSWRNPMRREMVNVGSIPIEPDILHTPHCSAGVRFHRMTRRTL